jgi:hypothetical protein
VRACERAERHTMREVELEGCLQAKGKQYEDEVRALCAAEKEIWRLNTYNRTGERTYSGHTQHLAYQFKHPDPSGARGSTGSPPRSPRGAGNA